VASAGLYANLDLDSEHKHASIPPLSFVQAGCPSCRPTNSIKALNAAKKQTYLNNKSNADNVEVLERPNVAISSFN